jgi:pyruvate dehydrogenase E2 component (dihydrolipoamide acetyltransferase)
MATLTLTVPDIGGAEGAEVVEVLVAVGDTITLEQSLIVLESDKASMEIPATAEGKILALKVALGDALSEGDAIAEIETSDEVASATPAPQGTTPSANPASADEAQATDGSPMDGGASDPAQTLSAPAAELAVITVEVPDIGTDGDVDLVELLVTTGQEVAEGDSLVLLESDKASMEVPAPAAGKITDVLVSAGGSVRQGTPLMTMAIFADGQSAAGSSPQASAAAGDAGTPSAAPQIEAQPTSGSVSASAPENAGSSIPTQTPIQTPMQEVADASAIDDGAAVYAGPAVRKLAREFGVDLSKVTGSGPRGRIVKEDLHHYVQQALKTGVRSADLGAGIPGIPEVDFSQFGAIEETPRSRLDKVTASNMTRSWLNVPHVTQFDDADITDLEDFRSEMKQEAEKRGTKLTPMPFILKACAVALGRHPKLKTSLFQGGETLVYKHYCHIGMAVDTPAGLVVPVIRDVDKKGLWELSEEMSHLAALARDKKLKPDQMQGGVFTISSLGNIGGRGFTPIVNAPEVAILGVSRASIQPVWTGSEFEPRKQLPLSLSYDHRMINGGDAGRFMTELVALLSDIRRALL